MSSHQFFLLAQDHTEYWDPLPPTTTKAYTIYLIKNGEATHCCSLTASSWAEFQSHEFYPSLEDPPYERDEDCYFNFTPHNPDNPHHGPLLKVDGRLSNENAWAAARDSFLDLPHILTNEGQAENSRRRLKQGLFA